MEFNTRRMDVSADKPRVVGRAAPSRAPLNGRGGRPIRVCLVAPVPAAAAFGHDVATFHGPLAEALALRGHEVTVALCGAAAGGPSGLRSGLDDETRRRISFVQVPDAPPWVESSGPRRRAYALYAWLREHEDRFDAVQVPESQGIGHYALAAGRQGVAFGGITFVVACSGASAFLAPPQRLSAGGLADALEQEFMERRSVERADVLVSPSASVLGWMRAQGWALPPLTRVQPYLLHPSVPRDEASERWTVLYELLSRRVAAGETASHNGRPRPLVSVCVTHHDRPELLRQALASIEAQDYPEIEVVLVDDASTTPGATGYLDRLEPEFDRRGWQIVRHDRNRFAGAARNTAAAQARGELLLFLDDDNSAKPAQVSTLVEVMRRTGADFVGSACDVFSHRDEPGDDEPPRRWIPLGPALAASVFRNCFGDVHALARRDAFVCIGGFAEDPENGFEDWEFFARAVLAGMELEVVPEPLFWYRSLPGTMVQTVDPAASHRRVLLTYRRAGGPNLNELADAAEAELEATAQATREVSANHPAA
jgi:GT2 family glycosyltransferase